MLNESICDFSEAAFENSAGLWEEEAIRRLAALVIPDGLEATMSWLIDADAKALRARWFLESLVDPSSSAASPDSLSYPHIYNLILAAVRKRAPDLLPDEQKRVARRLGSLFRKLAESRVRSPRSGFGRETKLLLRELYDGCWICGARFPEWADALFLGREPRATPTGLSYVDFLKPRGLKDHDLRIEVEHVRPLALGGGNDEENLRLSCGWCNRVKSANQLLFDSQGTCTRFEHPTLGFVSLPRSFWVVRILGVRGRCEHSDGCDATSKTHELTVAPRHESGSPNPSNLMVVCLEHDPLRTSRLIPASEFSRRSRVA